MIGKTNKLILEHLNNLNLNITGLSIELSKLRREIKNEPVESSIRFGNCEVSGFVSLEELKKTITELLSQVDKKNGNSLVG